MSITLIFFQPAASSLEMFFNNVYKSGNVFMFQIEIQGDSMMHNFIELAKSGNKGVSPSGHVTFSCPHNQPADPISFLTPESHLVRFGPLT